MSSQTTFEQAVKDVKRLNRCDNPEKLKFYGLYKQATGHDFSAATKPTPGKVMGISVPHSLDVESRKYEAWEEVRDLPVEEAQQQYIALFEQLKEQYGLKPE